MKKSYIISALFIFAVFLTAQTSQPHFSKISGVDNIFSNLAEKYSDKTESIYCRRDTREIFLSEQYYYEWVGNDWRRVYKILLYYDLEGNLSGLVGYYWESNNWFLDMQQMLQYDSDNNPIEVLTQIWFAGAWHNYRLELVTYDENDNMTEVLVQNWESNNWENNMFYQLSYNDENLRTELYLQIWFNEQWENETLELSEYDGNNNLIQVLVQNWVEENWVDDHRFTFSFDAENNMIVSLEETFFNEAWNNVELINNEYDENNNHTLSTTEYWYLDSWYYLEQSQFSYDENNDIIEQVDLIWNNEWVNFARYVYIYEDVSVDNNAVISGDDPELLIYPNPYSLTNSGNRINFMITAENIENAKINIYNLKGQKVTSLPIENRQSSSEWDGKDDHEKRITSGIYLIDLIGNGETLTTKKMLILN